MHRLLIIPLALLVLLAGAVVWSGTASEPNADLRFINRGEIRTLDPGKMSWAQDIRVASALWEGLFTLHPQTLASIPGAASKFDLSDDKTVYTFHIRPEARWSNGDPLRASDYVFAWRRVLEEPASYTYLLFYIKGAQDYHDAVAAGKPADFSTVGIEAVDEKTLRVTLKHPVPFLPDLTAFPTFFPLHEPSMRSFARSELPPGRTIPNYDPTFTKPGVVTNGPFRLESWAYKRRLRMVANEHYWDRANVKSRIIDQISADNPLAAFQIYETGGVDWLADVDPEIASKLREQNRSDLRTGVGFGTYFYSLNCLPTLPDGSVNPLHDLRVRQALAMAIDKRPIVETITRMGEPVTSNYVPPAIFTGYASPEGLPHDVKRARKLLGDAGYPQGKGFPTLTLLFNTGAHHDKVAQIVRRQWQTELGINVTLEGVEVKVFGERLHNQQYAIARASWIGDYNDVSTFTDKYLSVSDNNDSKWASAEYDRLCAQAAIEPDPAKRLEMLSRAEAILLEEAPIIPVYHYMNTYLHRDSVKGIVPNPRNQQSFKALEVVK